MSIAVDAGVRYCPSCEREFEGGELCPDDNTRLVRLIVRGTPSLGSTLDGRYTVGEPLGHGAMGNVYRGIQHSVGRAVAIKVISPALVGDPIVVKRFLREAKLACMLSHPNAVSVLDFGQTPDGLFYLVMELVTGRTLEDVLASERVLPATRVVRIGTQICDALEGAHQLQIVHRDLKPSNIMLLATGRDLVKVLDFGLAKSLAPRTGSAWMTTGGALLGTPAYMSPELVTGGVCDSRSDLYALGCVLYLAASGSPPFAANTVAELIALHASEPPAPLNDVPWELARVIERLLAKDPAARFQTAGEARLAIETALEREAAVEAAVEAATPTVLSPATATILGWTTSPSQASSTATAAAAAASASSSSSSTPRGSLSQAVTRNQPDDRELHTSAPALFVPGGIAPRVRARPRTLRWIVLSAVVALAAALLAALAVVR